MVRMPSSGRMGARAPAVAADDDDENEYWYSYMDEKGDKQGPFPGSYVFAWYQSGLMHKNVLVKQETRRKMDSGSEVGAAAHVLFETEFVPFKEFLEQLMVREVSKEWVVLTPDTRVVTRNYTEWEYDIWQNKTQVFYFFMLPLTVTFGTSSCCP